MRLKVAYILHSTPLPWLQKGQQNVVSSLSMRFFAAGFALDFLFPIMRFDFLFFSLKNKFRELILVSEIS
jgi:hypothetical protein